MRGTLFLSVPGLVKGTGMEVLEAPSSTINQRSTHQQHFKF